MSAESVKVFYENTTDAPEIGDVVCVAYPYYELKGFIRKGYRSVVTKVMCLGDNGYHVVVSNKTSIRTDVNQRPLCYKCGSNKKNNA